MTITYQKDLNQDILVVFISKIDLISPHLSQSLTQICKLRCLLNCFILPCVLTLFNNSYYLRSEIMVVSDINF
jgi:hypothetical protein